MELSIFPLNFSIFCRTLRFSAEVSNLPSKILIFRGTFESSAELFDFPRNQITTSAEEKIVQESFAVDSDFLNRLVAGPDGPAVVFSMSDSLEIGKRQEQFF
jgi:hypothetical protein